MSLIFHKADQIEKSRQRASPGGENDGNPKPSLYLNVLWTLFGNATYAVCQWSIFVVIARLGNLAMVGEFAIAMAIATPVFTLSNLNLRTIQVTSHGERYTNRHFFKLRILTTMLASLLVIGYAPLYTSQSSLCLTLVSVALVRAVESFSDVVHGVYHRHENMRAIGLARGIRGAMSLGSVTLVLYGSRSLPLAMITLAAVNLIVLIIVDLLPYYRLSQLLSFLKHAVPVGSEFTIVARIAMLCIPSAMAASVQSFNINLPRYLLASHIGSEAVGAFASIAYLLVAFDLFCHSVKSSALPRLSKMFQVGNRKEFIQLTLKLMALGTVATLPFLVITWLFGDILLKFAFGDVLADYKHEMVLMMIANVIWHGGPPSASLAAMNMYWQDFTVRFVSMLSTLTIGIIFIPAYHLEAAAWALISSRVVYAIATGIFIAYGVRHIKNESMALADRVILSAERCAA